MAVHSYCAVNAPPSYTHGLHSAYAFVCTQEVTSSTAQVVMLLLDSVLTQGLRHYANCSQSRLSPVQSVCASPKW